MLGRLDTGRGGEGGRAILQGRWAWPAAGSRGTRAFTLIELLVVILIIGILIALLTPMVTKALRKGKATEVKSMLNSIGGGLNQYHLDHGEYPGVMAPASPDTNAFPDLFEALLGERRPNGKGGISAPYMDNVKPDDIYVLDEGDDVESFRVCSPTERYDQNTPKYIMDVWGQPLRYRENKSKVKKEEWMIDRTKFDLWSTGPDGIDQSSYYDFDLSNKKDANGKPYDDLGNWN